MKAFPMFIRTSGRRVVIVGGGEQAAQKTRLMLKTDAQLDLVAPELEDELQSVVADGRARHVHGVDGGRFRRRRHGLYRDRLPRP